jgi:hypothetical protein
MPWKQPSSSASLTLFLPPLSRNAPPQALPSPWLCTLKIKFASFFPLVEALPDEWRNLMYIYTSWVQKTTVPKHGTKMEEPAARLRKHCGGNGKTGGEPPRAARPRPSSSRQTKGVAPARGATQGRKLHLHPNLHRQDRTGRLPPRDWGVGGDQPGMRP